MHTWPANLYSFSFLQPTMRRILSSCEELKSLKPPTLFVWGKADDDPDTVEIYRVFNAPSHGPRVLKEPVTVYRKAVDQAGLTSLLIRGGEHGSLDEIRIGTSMHSVLLGTRPPPAD